MNLKEILIELRQLGDQASKSFDADPQNSLKTISLLMALLAEIAKKDRLITDEEWMAIQGDMRSVALHSLVLCTLKTLSEDIK